MGADLFNYWPAEREADTYPNVPGSYPVATSVEAGEAMKEHCGKLQSVALSIVREAGADGATADEACERSGIVRAALQPRLSELRRKGLIADGGLRRRNASGKRAICWVLPEFVPPPPVREGAQ